MTPTAATLELLCLISGDPASKAFAVEISSDKTVCHLKSLISNLTQIIVGKLVLWCAMIPWNVDTDNQLIAGNIDLKRQLHSMETLQDVFKDGAPKATIHIIVEQPKEDLHEEKKKLQEEMKKSQEQLREVIKGLQGQLHEEKKALQEQLHEEKKALQEQLHEEKKKLEDVQSIFVLDVIVRPSKNKSFRWTADVEKTTVKELVGAIFRAYPEREDGKGDLVLSVIVDGRSEVPDDNHFRNILRQQRKTGGMTLVVALETPTKKYTDFTLAEVNTLYGISNMEAPDIPDLPSFDNILTESINQDALRKLCEELDARVRTMGSRLPSNEATCSTFVCSYITQAVLLFEKTLTLVQQRELRGKHGHGRVDFSIEAVGGMNHILGVTQVKREDFKKGLAQNLVQLESSLTNRKRKRTDDDDGKEEDEANPMKAYGIVTDAMTWYFVECSIDRSRCASSVASCPKFKVSRLAPKVDYGSAGWEESAKAIFGRIVWLMRQMEAEIPRRGLNYKRQETIDNVLEPQEVWKIQCTKQSKIKDIIKLHLL